jgi:hypothetical protein
LDRRGARELVEKDKVFAAFMERTKQSIRDNRKKTIQEAIARLNYSIGKIEVDDF